ncbi:MAG: hypothetical protein P1R58_08495 [bacterium]|nr:hypothetical protein [bacterium]
MKAVTSLIAVLFCLLLVSESNSQDTYYSIYSYNGFIPEVSINDRAASLQSSLLPEYYRSHAVGSDLKWLSENDTSLANWWRVKGDTALHLLRELSGLEWYETEFDIYLVRYHSSPGSGTPLILPVGGIQRGSLIEVAPDGNRQLLNLIYQLSHRMLDQSVSPQNGIRLPVADHPLMRPSIYRRDNLALLLAVSVCQSLIGVDSTTAAYESAFWTNHTPGRILFEKYFLKQWILTPEFTLIDWIYQEPWSSELVRVTRPPKIVETTTGGPRRFVEGLPLKGRLGFSVSNASSGLLRVDLIDAYRLAYACGLREGDLIRRVNGKRARNQKLLVQNILASLEESGGATLQIVRNDRRTEVLIQPRMLPIWEDDEAIFYEDQPVPDSSSGYNNDPYNEDY